MYAACLFCHRALGRNAVLGSFPAGRRLAFDGARGRLWVVCPHCARWNLTPLDERWEAVEEAERLFRSARVRAATDEIALARVPGGLDLVRVGRAQRRELAAWRYGRELGRRLLRTAGLVAGGTTVLGVAAAGLVPAVTLRPEMLVLLQPAFALLAFQFGGLGLSLRPIHVPGPDGRAYEVFRSEFDRLHLTRADDGAWGVRVKHGYGVLEATGADAVAALRPLLAAVNRRGARRARALDAAAWIDAHGGADAAVGALARASGARSADFERVRREFERLGRYAHGGYSSQAAPANPGALHRLAAVERLALEIAVVEDAERRAMEEELAPLVAAWRDAEAIAAIADGLGLPRRVEESAARLRAGRDGAA